MSIQVTREEYARRIIQRELGRTVVIHDNGRAPSMYDLRIGNTEIPEIAIECVGAVDRQRTETWNVGPGRGSFRLPVDGDWHVVLRPGARVKQVRDELLCLLREAVGCGLDEFVPVDTFLRHRSPLLFEHCRRLRIDSLGRYGTGAGTGKVYLGMTGIGGAVDVEGRAVPGWIGDFLRAKAQEDVLLKLRASQAKQAHVFVQVSFGGVPWPVESYLGTSTESLPRDAPDLPPPVDAVWIMYGGRGVRWDGEGWRFFDSTVPAVA